MKTVNSKFISRVSSQNRNPQAMPSPVTAEFATKMKEHVAASRQARAVARAQTAEAASKLGLGS